MRTIGQPSRRRQIMEVLCVNKGDYQYKGVRKLVDRTLSLVATHTGKDIITVIKESAFWQNREHIITLRREAGVPMPHLAPKFTLAPNDVFSVLNIKDKVWRKKLMPVVNELVQVYLHVDQIAEAITEYSLYVEYQAEKQAQEERAIKQREAQLVHRLRVRKEKAARLRKMPREQRLKGWGVIATDENLLPAAANMRYLLHIVDTRFAELQAFAINAQNLADSAARRREKMKREAEREAAESEARRLQREAERPARLKQLDTQAERENILEHRQRFIRENIPTAQLNEFRLWFHRNQYDLTDDIEDVVNDFLGPVVSQTAPEVPDAIISDLVTESPTVAVYAPPAATTVRPKRKGSVTTIMTRPEQAAFSRAVEVNCDYTCVVTGSRIHARCEAAHLVEHSAEGEDHFTNGLWLRSDIHALFDKGMCAIDPATLKLYFRADALALDPDLNAWNAQVLRPTRRPINPLNLTARWDAFNEHPSLSA